MTRRAVDNIDTWSTAEPRHCHRGRLLRLLYQSADRRVSYHRSVDVEALWQHQRICVVHMQTIVQSSSNVTANIRISCVKTVKSACMTGSGYDDDDDDVQ